MLNINYICIMNGRQLNLADSIRILNRKNDCMVIGTAIFLIAPNSKAKTNDIGNKCFGRIDYLKSLGYRQNYVEDFKELKKGNFNEVLV